MEGDGSNMIRQAYPAGASVCDGLCFSGFTRTRVPRADKDGTALLPV